MMRFLEQRFDRTRDLFRKYPLSFTVRFDFDCLDRFHRRIEQLEERLAAANIDAD